MFVLLHKQSSMHFLSSNIYKKFKIIITVYYTRSDPIFVATIFSSALGIQ